MWQYKTDSSCRSAFPIGLTHTENGIHISVVAAAKTCELLLFPSRNGNRNPDCKIPAGNTEPKKSKEKKNTDAAGNTSRPEATGAAVWESLSQAEGERHLAAQLADAVRIPFTESGRTGNVWEMDLEVDDLDNYTYAFAADGRIFADPYGRQFSGREIWGDPAQSHTVMKCSFKKDELFDWQGDQPLRIPYEDSIIYRLHVRGFTRHTSAKVPGHGTFEGIIAMIPYLKELGITTLELMPVSEFQEVMVAEHPADLPYSQKKALGSQKGIGQSCGEPTGRLNYWGYTTSLLMAPKASYAGSGKDPQVEFKKLVRALHQAGIELVAELYFDGKESWNYVLDAVRFWVQEYHVDGIHLTGYAVPVRLLAQDPYLTHTKLWASYWEEDQLREEVQLRNLDISQPAADTQLPGSTQPPSAADTQLPGSGQAHSQGGSIPRPKLTRRLAEYNDGFLIDMRRALKGDEGQMRSLVDRFCRNPEGCGVINYLATTNGFTLADLVAYDEKHNEANGENNRDGNENNYSWNCGIEGPTRKKKILDLRKKQVRNALLLLFLSQGTPLLMAGDEFGNSQEGNNNAYCQDNDISWLNWKQTRAGRQLTEFVKYVISFRKAHPVFHKAHAPRLMDYLSCGHPDVSYHGLNTWYPEFEDFRRQIGIMYCGSYGRRADGTPDDYFYVACNFHWEPHEFALPNLPKGMFWYTAFDTSSQGTNGYYPAGSEPKLENQKRYMVPSRTVMVLIGKKENVSEWEPAGNSMDRSAHPLH